MFCGTAWRNGQQAFTSTRRDEPLNRDGVTYFIFLTRSCLWLALELWGTPVLAPCCRWRTLRAIDWLPDDSYPTSDSVKHCVQTLGVRVLLVALSAFVTYPGLPPYPVLSHQWLPESYQLQWLSKPVLSHQCMPILRLLITQLPSNIN